MKKQQKVKKKVEKGIVLKENTTDLQELSKPQELAYISKKKEYATFKAIIRQGKFTSAVMAAEILGVDRMTISKWMKTAPIRKLLAETTNKYVEKIEASTDWKAQAYLLDNLRAKEEKQGSNTMVGLSITIQK